eukprot:TRINITY_DN3395_c0_g1_i1.p1 TRINITY_DN3395_c0_g1~~TRINITY_DN3395_c0_g1_i1.p1  ORF type:complete len:168 (+),score=59.46 TRINITY_DN3395_c0_g1_i1:109-612(+)
MQRGLVGSEMCIRDRYQRRVHGDNKMSDKEAEFDEEQDSEESIDNPIEEEAEAEAPEENAVKYYCYLQELLEEEEKEENHGTKIPPEERTTTRYLTKYERARILGTRALQITKNAPILVDIEPGDTDPLKIAEKELMAKKIPFIIRRYLPDGSYEDWSIQELIIEYQ